MGFLLLLKIRILKPPGERDETADTYPAIHMKRIRKLHTSTNAESSSPQKGEVRSVQLPLTY